MTWTVASGDQITFAYTLIGTTMVFSLQLDTTTVGGTPNVALQVAIPGGFTATKTMAGPCYVIDNGVRGNGVWSVTATGSVVQIFLNSAGNWAAATDTTYVKVTAAFEVT
jgi:hypothetical protein